MDSIDAGQATGVPESDEPVSEDVSDATVGGEQPDDDQSGHDTGRGRETDDNRTGSAPAEHDGETVDEGVTDGPDRSSVPGGDDVLEPVPDERVEEESNASAGRFRDFAVIGHAFGRF